jgi:RNA polymerase sigma-70 factor (ECF subfamily)
VNEPAEIAFRAHYDQVLRFVRRRTDSNEDAEDIVQSVFADASVGLNDFQPGETPVLAWLYTVAQRRLIDHVRRAGTARRHASEELRPVEDAEYGQEVASVLRQALTALPARQRDVVLLRLIEGRSFAEISAQTGDTEASCKMRFARGVTSVREYLRKEGVRP